VLDGIALKHGDKKAVYQKLQKSTVERKTIWQCESSSASSYAQMLRSVSWHRRAVPSRATPRPALVLCWG